MSTPSPDGKVTRAWGDIARKLISVFVAGFTTTLVIGIGGAVGIEIDQTLASSIVLIVSTLAGYITKGRAIE
jgi:hypothetical protein